MRMTKRPTARILPWGILSVLTVLLFSYCLGREGGAPVSEASVEFNITPGKPDAPTERVKLTKQGNAYRLYTQRIDPQGQLLAAAEAELPAEAFERVWSIVQAQELTVFKPQAQQAKAYDFGERRLEMHWRLEGESGRQSHTTSWIQPLDNEYRIRPLVEMLGYLAATYTPQAPLYYFPSRK